MLWRVQKAFGYTAYYWSNSFMGTGGSKTPSILKGFENKVQNIKFGQKHSGLIDDENNLYLWGENDNGQLGILDSKGNKIKRQEQPQLVNYFQKHDIKIVDFQLGKNHTLALDNQGRVFSWGKGSLTKLSFFKWFYPQTLALGHETNDSLDTPKPIKYFKYTPIEQISTGNDFAMALSKNGELFVWGRGEFGVLGFVNHSLQLPTINPLIQDLVQKTLKSKIKKIGSIQDFSSVLFDNGELYSFGNNDYGVMGIGTTQSVDTCDVIRNPTKCVFENDEQIPLQDFSQGEMQSAFLSNDKRVFYCGWKLYYRPWLFGIDYKNLKVKTFGATDKGVAVITQDNWFFFSGNFWKGKIKEENVQTGIKEVKVELFFDGKTIEKVGGQNETKFVLVK